MPWPIASTVCLITSLSTYFKRYGQEEVNSLKWENAALEVKKVYQSVLGWG